MAITLEQAKNLHVGQTIYHAFVLNADGTAQRWRVNGRPKTWKTRPDEVQVPIKHGLYDFGYLNEALLENFSLTEPPRVAKDKIKRFGGRIPIRPKPGQKKKDLSTHCECGHKFTRGDMDGGRCLACGKIIFPYPAKKTSAKKGAHKTIKKPGDPTYDPRWSGVSFAPHARGKKCARCGSHVHNEDENYYCPYCDDYVSTVSGKPYAKPARSKATDDPMGWIA